MYVQQPQNPKHDFEFAIWIRRLSYLVLFYFFLDGMTRLALPLMLAFAG